MYCPAPYPSLLLQPPALMASGMAMRVEWIVVVLAVLPAQLAATALLVAIAPVSAAVPQIKLVWQVSHAGRWADLVSGEFSHVYCRGICYMNMCTALVVVSSRMCTAKGPDVFRRVYCSGLWYLCILSNAWPSFNFLLLCIRVSTMMLSKRHPHLNLMLAAASSRAQSVQRIKDTPLIVTKQQQQQQQQQKYASAANRYHYFAGGFSAVPSWKALCCCIMRSQGAEYQ
jgi:hypothetical protein